MKRLFTSSAFPTLAAVLVSLGAGVLSARAQDIRRRLALFRLFRLRGGEAWDDRVRDEDETACVLGVHGDAPAMPLNGLRSAEHLGSPCAVTSRT